VAAASFKIIYISAAVAVLLLGGALKSFAQEQDPSVHRINQRFACVIQNGEYRLSQIRPRQRRRNVVNTALLNIFPEQRIANAKARLPRVRQRLRAARRNHNSALAARLQNRLRNMRRIVRMSARCDALTPPAPDLSCLDPSGSNYYVVAGSSKTISFDSCSGGLEISLVSPPVAGDIAVSSSAVTYTASNTGSVTEQVALKICEPSDSGGLLQLCDNNYILNFTSCGISLASTQAEAFKGSTSQVQLSSNNSCGSGTSYHLKQQPQVGTASISGAALSLNIPYEAPSEIAVALNLCALNDAGCAEATLMVSLMEADHFSGDPESLAPYRQSITSLERLHLLRRLAYGHPSYLAGEGKTMSLDDLLEKRILNRFWYPEETKEILEHYREIEVTFHHPSNNDPFIKIVDPKSGGEQSLLFLDGQTDSKQIDTFDNPLDVNEGIFRLMTVSARSYHNNLQRYFWSTRWASGHYLFRSRYLSAVETMMSHLWLGHFGSSNVGIHDLYGYHMLLVERESLGNFRTLLTGTSETGCGTPSTLIGGGELAGMICDPLSAVFLDNQLNTKNSPNENFPRELLELYTMSPYDNISGMKNYTDIDDVVAATAYMSGYKYSKGQGKLEFDPSRHNNSPQNAFLELAPYYPSLALENKSMQPREFVNHLLDHHPGVPRFIAGKLFSMLVYPDPSDALVEELGEKLKQFDYDIYEFLRFISRSEAMFSQKARYRECVHEPFRRMSETINMLQLSMVSFEGPFGSHAHQLFHRMYSNLRDISDIPMEESGEQVLSYPDVFSYEYCGRNPGVTGREEWLPGAKLIGRIRGTIELLRISRQRLKNDFTLLHIRDLIINNPYTATTIHSVSQIGVDELIDFFSLIHFVELSPGEREVIAHYITHNTNGAAVQWNPNDDTLFSTKVAGLIAIFASLAQANIY